MKTHLLVFDSTQVEKNIFRDKIDALDSIENWTLLFGNTMFLASKKNARELSDEIRPILLNVSFIITTVDPQQKDGWLPKSLWRFLNDPAPARTNIDA